MSRLTLKSIGAMAALAVIGVSPAISQQFSKDGAVNTPPANVEKIHSSANADSGYLIGPEDVISVNVWKEPELSATVPVRPDGKISLPLLNDVDAAGRTPMELSKQVAERLKKFVADPTVTVGLNAINSKRIYVLGQVSRPGTFPLVPSETVLQALSSAGGLQQFANTKKIYVLRKSQNGSTEKLPFNYKRAIRGEQSSGDILLNSGDTIVVP